MQLPIKLLQSLQGTVGYEEGAFKEVHKNPISITSIRINTQKTTPTDADLPITQKVPWTENGYYLSYRPSFTLNPLLHAGSFYVQEASSMFLEQVFLQKIDAEKPIKVLDLCAAPGGKSTHILSLLNDNSFLISNEIIGSRNNILQENITKWGSPNCMVTQNDAKDFATLQQYFDVIVIDAPCSGSGLFRRDENAMREWSENNVALCSQRQQRIISDLLPALKNDGLLIYSTCSYSVLENEAIMDWLQKEMHLENQSLDIKAEWNITTTVTENNNIGYRFWPHHLHGEGFFLSCFKKREDAIVEIPKKPKTTSEVSVAEAEILSNTFKKEMFLKWVKHQDVVLGIPPTLADDLPFLQSKLYIKMVGISIGTIIKKQLVPAHHLAMSNLITDAFLVENVQLEQALDFLRKKDFVLQSNETGWFLIQFKKTNLGFLKNLGNRMNNYYPKNWRILR